MLLRAVFDHIRKAVNPATRLRSSSDDDGVQAAPRLQLAQSFSRQLQSLFAHHQVLAGEPRLLGVAEDLEPADHHVLPCELALRFSDAPLSTVRVVFGELVHQQGRAPLSFEGERPRTIALAAPIRIATCTLNPDESGPTR